MRWWPFALGLAVGCPYDRLPPLPDAPRMPDAPDILQDCVVMLHMNEPEWNGTPGEVLDACSGDHNGRRLRNANTILGGVRDRAGRFNKNGCVEIADVETLRLTTALTMSAWVRPSGYVEGDAYGVISKRSDMTIDSAYNMYLWHSHTVWVDLDGTNNRFNGNFALIDGTWAQVTVTYNGARPENERARIYHNGTLKVIATVGTPTLPAFTAPLSVGCLPSSQGGNQDFSGDLDEVAIWRRALTDSDVMQWYTATMP